MTQKLQLGIGAGLIVALVLGGIIWWQQPARVVDGAIRQLAATDRQRFQAELRMENVEATQQLLGEKSAVTITLDGAYDRRAGRRPALAAQMTVGAKTESVSLEIAGEIRFIDDQAYFIITKAPVTLTGLASLRGRWLELPRGAVGESQPTVRGEQLFTNVKRVGDRRYQAIGQAATIVHFMNHVANLLGTQLTVAQIEELRRNVASVETLPVELWITPWRHELQQLVATLKAPSGNDVYLTLKFSAAGEPVIVEAPAGAKNIQDALGAPKE